MTVWSKAIILVWVLWWFVGTWFFAMLVRVDQPGYTVWTAICGQASVLWEFSKAMVRALGIGG